MPVPLVTVSDVVVDQQGRPVRGAEVTARLDRVETYDGLVVPAQARAVSGEDGRFELRLFPNTLGSQGSRYEVRLSTPSGALVRGLATVPEAGGLLRELMDLPAPGTYGEALVAQARSLKEDSVAARDQAVAQAEAASASAEAAALAASGTEAARQIAESARDAALAARGGAESALGGAELARDSAMAAKSGAESARDAALAVRPPHARVIGGLAYQILLGTAAPSLELDAWKAKDLAGGIPVGCAFTRASAATRNGPTGLVESVASGVLRHEWDPETLEYLGMLLEEGRTNSARYSGDFSQSAWSKVRGLLTASAAKGISGSMTAAKFFEDTQSGRHHLNQIMTGLATAAGDAITISCWVAQAGRSRVVLGALANGAFATTKEVAFDLAAGAHGSLPAGVSAAGVKRHAATGLWRVWVVVLADQAGDVQAALSLADESGALNYQGDGASGVYVDGFQVERGAFPTSYIPTTSAATTRAADVLTMATADWLRPKEGTLLCEVVFGHGVIGNYNRIWSLDDGTNSNRINVFVNTLGNIGMASSVSGAQTTALPNIKNAAAHTRFLVALGYSASEVAGCADGGGVSSASGALPDGLTTLRMGTWHSNNQQLNGHIRRLAYFPRHLTNAQLQELTYAG